MSTKKAPKERKIGGKTFRKWLIVQKRKRDALAVADAWRSSKKSPQNVRVIKEKGGYGLWVRPAKKRASKPKKRR